MYEIVLPTSVAKQIRKLPKRFRDRVLDKIDQLGVTPRPDSGKKLVGEELYRLRVSDYRIVYAIDDTQKKVVIVRVAHRREVYR